MNAMHSRTRLDGELLLLALEILQLELIIDGVPEEEITKALKEELCIVAEQNKSIPIPCLN